MARTVWDDIDEPPTEEAATRVRLPATPPTGTLPTRKRRATLPWLLVALGLTAGAAALTQWLEERRTTRAQLGAARDESAALRRSLFLAEDRIAAVEDARQREAANAASLKQSAASNDRLIAELRAKLDSKDGDVSSENNRITVSLMDQILFKSGDATLSPRGKELLSRVGDVMKGLTDKQILIGGHTDDRPIHTPQFPSNWELSSARAVNVVRHLAEVVGVDPARLTAAGYSQFQPRSKRDKAKNRRIEILLTPRVAVQ